MMIIKILFGIALIGIALFMVLELSLRLIWGWGNPLIYISDPDIGYLISPNQITYRGGNKIKINEFSMRSESLNSSVNARILLIGDSIVNGGWWTDQDEILSALIAKLLGEVEVLNASANSWGPCNELAYLKRFGLFDAQYVVLVINTDDLFADLPDSEVVGREVNYPDTKPIWAICEVISRYQKKTRPKGRIFKGDIVKLNLEAITNIYNLVSEQNKKFLLVMTPLLREVSQEGARDYEIKARSRLSGLTQEYDISFLDLLNVFKETDDPKLLFRDHIHLSEVGYVLVSQKISALIKI